MESTYSEGIAKKILFDPIGNGANKLCILSSHATPSMASWLMTTYEEQGIENVSIELIIESTVDDGIDTILHEGFKELHRNRHSGTKDNFSCSYLHQQPISKKNAFIWLENENPVQAFNCTYEFTQTSMLRNRSGSLTERSATYAYKLYESAVNRSIFCNHSEVEDYVVIRSPHTSLMSDASVSSDNCVNLSLVTKSGEPGSRSGLNWGQRKGRNPNEAYIPLPSKIAKSGFFPLDKQHFLAVTDDHHTLQLRVELQNDKAITTPASNAQLGEYFRNRLELSNGAYVNASHLNVYGRTFVTFYKIDEEQYYMDFSPSSKR